MFLFFIITRALFITTFKCSLASLKMDIIFLFYTI